MKVDGLPGPELPVVYCDLDMLIPDPFLSCIVFLYKTEKGARDDSDFQAVGFVVGIPTKTVNPPQTFKYLVTCDHVIRDLNGKVVLRINTDKSYRIVKPSASDWIRTSKYDLAILPLSLTHSDVFSAIQEDAFASRENVKKYMIGHGDDVFLIGRIQQPKVYQQTQNIPALRFGNIASVPKHEIWSYMVELRSVGGHSGSPVFAFCNGLSWPGTRKAENIFLYQFLGMNVGHIEDYADVVRFEQTSQGLKEVKAGSHYAKTNVAISLTIPAYYIGDILNSPALEKKRNRQEKQYNRSKKSIVDD